MLTDATLNSLGTSLAALITHVSLHSANPGSTGASETTAARLPVSWNVDADGDLTMTSQKDFTGVAANGAVQFVGLWSALTGGTFRGYHALTGDATANAAGAYSVTQVTINGTSTS